MGNFEKLVVLIVLFLAAVVLAVSLRDGEVAAEGPLEAAKTLLEEEAAPPMSDATPATSPAAPVDRAGRTGRDEPREQQRLVAAKDEVDPTANKPSPGFLLDAATREEPVAAPPRTTTEAVGDQAPVESLDDGPVRILRTTRGLEPSALEDFMVYTVEAGDTWSSLAQRFYRDRGLAEVLGRANEGVRELVAGTSILVPVYDLAREAQEREPWTPVAASGDEPAADASKGAAPVEAGSHLGATSYVVANGDTLSGISLKVYGSAQHWKEIFEANRQRMASPDWLQVGMRLSIPQGSDLEALRKSQPKEAQGRPRVR